MVLYLLFADSYERISSTNNKQEIVTALSDRASSYAASEGDSPGVAIDRQLLIIRRSLESEYPNQEIDFYLPPAENLWKAEPEPPPPPRDDEHGPTLIAKPSIP